ncbi:MAG: GGDEF domain-containing protein [Candidatus Cloacimonadota bacterium]|nr:GGDEF domain-containing protein [Candidatus Cloacimonadota bacterium]
MQKSDKIEKSLGSIFEKEAKIVVDCQKILENPDTSKTELLKEFNILTKEYQKILRSFAKITRLSDSSNKKLFHTHELLKDKSLELKETNIKLYKVSITDKLTQIYNRSFLLKSFAKEFLQSKRYNFDLSCIMIDIDHFKKVNDNYGHLVGDFMLKEITHTIQDHIRQADTFGRYGGEEFLIILPYTNIDNAYIVSEKIRKVIEVSEFFYEDKLLKATISLGLSDNQSSKITKIDDMIKRSDIALYRAKNEGRNCTRIYEIF